MLVIGLIWVGVFTLSQDIKSTINLSNHWFLVGSSSFELVGLSNWWKQGHITFHTILDGFDCLQRAIALILLDRMIVLVPFFPYKPIVSDQENRNRKMPTIMDREHPEPKFYVRSSQTWCFHFRLCWLFSIKKSLFKKNIQWMKCFEKHVDWFSMR